MKKNKLDIQSLREVLQATTRDDWWRSAPSVDNSRAKIFPHAGNVPVGSYFLCDCIGNTIDLCLKTKRRFRNPAGRLVGCKVIVTIILDCREKFGTPLNGVWQIPYNLIKNKP